MANFRHLTCVKKKCGTRTGSVLAHHDAHQCGDIGQAHLGVAVDVASIKTKVKYLFIIM